MTNKIDSNIIAAAYDSVYEFNDICNQFEGDVLDSINLSISLCYEELVEVIDAFDELTTDSSDLTKAEEIELTANLVKEVVDLRVVVDGLTQKIANAGLDSGTAILAVTENNLSKMPETMPTSQEHWCNQHGWTVTYNDKYSRFTIKDINGKTMKPYGYVKCTLGEIIHTSLLDAQNV